MSWAWLGLPILIVFILAIVAVLFFVSKKIAKHYVMQRKNYENFRDRENERVTIHDL